MIVCQAADRRPATSSPPRTTSRRETPPSRTAVCASPPRPKVFAWTEIYLRMKARDVSRPAARSALGPHGRALKTGRRGKLWRTTHTRIRPQAWAIPAISTTGLARGEGWLRRGMFRHFVVVRPVRDAADPRAACQPARAFGSNLKWKFSRARDGNQPLVIHLRLLGNMD